LGCRDAVLLIGKTTIAAARAPRAAAALLRILGHPVNQAGSTRAPAPGEGLQAENFQ